MDADTSPISGVFDRLKLRLDQETHTFLSQCTTIIENAISNPEQRVRPIKKSSSFATKYADFLGALGYKNSEQGYVLPTGLQFDRLIPKLRMSLAMIVYMKDAVSSTESGIKLDKLQEEEAIRALCGAEAEEESISQERLMFPQAKNPYFTLGVTRQDHDDVIAMVARCLMATRTDLFHVINDCTTSIAEMRKSPALRSLASEIQAKSRDYDDSVIAFQNLGVSLNETDERIVAMFWQRCKAQPDMRETLINILMMIQNARPESYVISEALAACMDGAENGDGTMSPKVTRPLDPERIAMPPRTGDDARRLLRSEWHTPVGLTNTRNMCYFNAIVQTLFGVPSLRKLVLNSAVEYEDNKQHNFTKELRMLLAFMQETLRTAVSAEPAAQALLEDSSRSSVGQQQDVSEMMSMTIDKLLKSATPSEIETYNSLLAGEQVETRRDGTTSSQPFFGLHLNMNVESQSLHSGLDSWARSESSQNSFSKLPRVLLFPIMRAGFEAGMAVRRNARFEFPTTLYMDKYLTQNMETVMEIQESITSQRAALEALNTTYAELSSMSAPLGSLDELLRTTGAVVASLPLLDEERSEQLTGELVQAADVAINVMQKLDDRRKMIVEEIQNAYADFNKLGYELHTIVAHDGAAAQRGHYITYRASPNKGRWLRLNDTAIQEIGEEQMKAETYGGTDGRAAALLVYVLSGSEPVEPQIQVADELMEIIATDNARVRALASA